VNGAATVPNKNELQEEQKAQQIHAPDKPLAPINQIVRKSNSMIRMNEAFDNQIEVKQAIFGFESYKRRHQVFPENTNINDRFLAVDVEHRIDEQNKAFDVSKSEIDLDSNRISFQQKIHTRTISQNFLTESIRLVENYDGWKSFRNKGRYVNNIAYMTLRFSYHKEYFNDKVDFIINPEIKPEINNKSDKYQRIIENKYGCDGIISALGIIEADGELTNIEIIGHEGRISGSLAVNELKSLGKWEPAKHENRKVRSQVDLLIYI